MLGLQRYTRALEAANRRPAPAWQAGDNCRDSLLQEGEELLPGTRLISRRRGYLHHGLYVGEGRVVHYYGRACGLAGGKVEEVSLARFGHGKAIWVRRSLRPATFATEEVVRRARSRIGEDQYQLLGNNCEHFCERCLYGTARSYQVERVLESLGPLRSIATRMARLKPHGRGYVSRRMVA
jgi:cell wall-associated NlpC family hydrolase